MLWQLLKNVVTIAHHAGVAQLVERNLAKVEVESSRLFSRSSFQGGPQGASKQFLWRGSKEVMQRPAKPFRRVRFPSSPPDEKNSPLSSGLFFLPVRYVILHAADINTACRSPPMCCAGKSVQMRQGSPARTHPMPCVQRRQYPIPSFPRR